MLHHVTSDLRPTFLFCVLFLFFGTWTLHAREVEFPENPFTRLTYSEAGTLKSFDTSFVTFVSADGQTHVTLVGAIHIGEAAYYKTLNERFTQYDAVLFEMVGDGDPRPVSASESSGFIGAVQRLSAHLMGLKFQIGSIDYYAENFVHADMTSVELKEGMKQRGDGFVIWFMRSMGYGMAVHEEFNLDAERGLLELLGSRNKTRALRRFSAKSMADIRSTAVAMEGKNGSTLLRDRNTKALQVLRRELDAGKKNVAIFYGAAHLPDFAQRLQDEFSLKPEKVEWIQCWKLD